MKTYKKRARITTAATVLAVVVAAVVGFTVWFAYHSSQVADSTLKSANKVSSDIPKVPAITDFASCEKAGGSKTLQTYPEQCVTTSGKKYTDTPKYLVIKEWGVKVPLSTPMYNAIYKNDDQSRGNGIMLVSYPSLGGSICAIDQNGLGQIWRFTAEQRDVFDGKPELSKFPDAKKIGSYYYGFEATSSNSSCETKSMASDWTQAVAHVVLSD